MAVPSRPDPSLMEYAIDLGRRKVNEDNAKPYAAIVVKDNQIIGEGWNMQKAKYDVTSHGEVEAIRNTMQRLKVHHLRDCEMYTTCEPCPLCVATINYVGISRIYYADQLSALHYVEDGMNDLYGKKASELQTRPCSELTFAQFIHVPELEAKAHKVYEEWCLKDSDGKLRP